MIAGRDTGSVYERKTTSQSQHYTHLPQNTRIPLKQLKSPSLTFPFPYLNDPCRAQLAHLVFFTLPFRPEIKSFENGAIKNKLMETHA